MSSTPHYVAAWQALQQQHEKAFADMRAYFNGVVRDTLGATMALKAELSEQKHKEASTAALLQDVVSENQRLSEPLSKVGPATLLCCAGWDPTAVGND